MNVRDIPRAQWPAFLDQFSRTHRAWLATIDAGASGADGHAADAYPLRSITPFVYNDRVVHIDIRFQDDPQTNAPIRITAPGTLRVDETWEGVAQALEIIDSHGISSSPVGSNPPTSPVLPPIVAVADRLAPATLAASCSIGPPGTN
jgi:hypothetical protein